MLIYLFRRQLLDLLARVLPGERASQGKAAPRGEPLMRVISDEAELAQIRQARIGYIFNDYSPGTGPNGEIYKILHAASCPSLRMARITEHPKYFAPSLRDATGWLQANRGGEGADWKRCDFAGDPINN